MDVPCVFDHSREVAHAAIESYESVDAIISCGCEEVGDSAPTESHHSNFGEVRIRQGAGEADQERDVLRLCIGSRDVVSRLTSYAHSRSRNDDEPVTGKVFAKIDILPRDGREAWSVDDDGELSGRKGSVARCPHGLLEDWLHGIDKHCLHAGQVFRVVEARLGRLESYVVTERHRLRIAFLCGVPDESLQGPGALALIGFPHRIDCGLEGTGVVVLFDYLEAYGVWSLLLLQGEAASGLCHQAERR